MTKPPPPACNGLCLTGFDVGVPSSGIAYAHPCCPEHGDPHPFEWSGKTHTTHGGVLKVCDCGAYEDDHAR